MSFHKRGLDNNEKNNNFINNNEYRLIQYSLVVLSTYNNDNKYMGLKNIQLLNYKQEKIQILNYNSNCLEVDSFNLRYLFNDNNNQYEDNYFITQFFKGLTINFSIISKYEIEKIIINNFNEEEISISPIKDIEIYKNNILIYKGSLLKNREFNCIRIGEIKYSNVFQENKRFFSSSKTKYPQKRFFTKENIYSARNINNYDINNININFRSMYDMLSPIEKSKSFNIKPQEKKYISFNKIRLIITQNYGNRKNVGLTGIEFYDLKNELISVETAETIGAMPKDLRTIYDDENDDRIFENVFNGINNTDDETNMWLTSLKKEESPPYIELFFADVINIKRIKIYNFNKKNELEKCTKTIEIYLDDEYYDTIYLYQGIGETCLENKDKKDFGQDITFPIKKIDLSKYENKKDEIKKYASFLYEQCYETPYLPCGYIFKFEFISNFSINYKENDNIGLDKIEIYNENGDNLFNVKEYKILTNTELISDKEILFKYNNIKLCYYETYNDSIYYIFSEPVFVSYIKFSHLKSNTLDTVKDIKIFCDSNIIFEGSLHNYNPTIVLFTCDIKITRDLNEKFLSSPIKKRQMQNERNDEYISLIFN